MNTLFHGLVDDAGLFPPTQLSMAGALDRHIADVKEGSPVLTHRFLCPSSRLDELRTLLMEPIRIGLILEAPRVPSFDDLDVELIEVRLPAAGELPRHLPVYYEPPREPGWLDVVAGLPRAKVRCGGLSPSLFPTAAELGAFIQTCVDGGIPFKATAGLHNAVRRFDPMLAVHRHGFLNLVTAVCAAVDGGDVTAVLESEDADELVRLARAVSDETAARARELFVSYGSCSTRTPIKDLRNLGLLEK
ncbi:hypothetical protein [Rhizohabitans arisaemae]|uniref:hypothetical protein n=1 Tax=Rhizohabitans arisaemae TaxID=2720610 RepID=UPI0024B1F17D|nr:hypothetical protein [Rhizohabitans arisaemae]